MEHGESMPAEMHAAKHRFMKIAAPVLIGVFVLLGLFLFTLTLNQIQDFSHGNLPYSNSITVEGTGKATVIPNIAQITFSVTEDAAKVADAQNAATEKTNAALDALKKQGVADKDIKTIGYNVSPKYDYGQPCMNGFCPQSTPKVIGYTVSQTIEVKVRDTSKAGDVLQDLGTLGVQNISGPNFVLDDAEEGTAAARADAIKDAQDKAKVLAKQLGVHLGKVTSFYEGGQGIGYGGDMAAPAMMGTKAEAPSIPVGEGTQSVTVTITYEIN